MAPTPRTAADLIATAAYFDRFEPLRKMAASQQLSDAISGAETIKNMHEALAASSKPALREGIAKVIEQRSALSLLTESLVAKLDLDRHILAGSLAEQRIQELAPQATLAQAFRQADLHGMLRLQLDQNLSAMEEFRKTTLIASSVLEDTQLQQAAVSATANPITGVLESLRFEPGTMLARLGQPEGEGLLLGRQAMRDLFAASGSAWGAQLDALTITDLVAPVESADDEPIIAAFPPDLVEEEPLSSAFEVDAVVAEHQIGAQVFLALRSPPAAARMDSARTRLREGDPEALSQSLTSCRRALHALADTVYPPRRGKVKDRRGTPREVHAEAVKNRLLIFLGEAIDGARPRALAEAQVELVVRQLDALVDQLSKGVHADVVRDEAAQAYVETWAFIARVARVVARDD